MKSRIVTDNEKRPRRGGSLSDRLEDVMGSCVIEAFDRVCGEPGPNAPPANFQVSWVRAEGDAIAQSGIKAWVAI